MEEDGWVSRGEYAPGIVVPINRHVIVETVHSKIMACKVCTGVRALLDKATAGVAVIIAATINRTRHVGLVCGVDASILNTKSDPLALTRDEKKKRDDENDVGDHEEPHSSLFRGTHVGEQSGRV